MTAKTTTVKDQKPTTLYRNGNRSTLVRHAKNLANRQYRRELAESEFPEEARQVVLAAVRDGATVREAAATVNVTAGIVYGRARWDVAYASALDDALDYASRDRMSEYCGTPTGYRTRGCTCRKCRAAHAEEVGRYR